MQNLLLESEDDFSKNHEAILRAKVRKRLGNFIERQKRKIDFSSKVLNAKGLREETVLKRFNHLINRCSLSRFTTGITEWEPNAVAYQYRITTFGSLDIFVIPLIVVMPSGGVVDSQSVLRRITEAVDAVEEQAGKPTPGRVGQRRS